MSWGLIFIPSLFSQNTTVKKEITDADIIEPEHLTKKLATLLHDWQIDFAASNENCAQGHNVVYHDSVYTDRLYALPTEMEMSFNQVVRQYIEMYTQRRRDLVAHMLTIGNYYFPMFEEALDKEGLPLELKYLPVIESALNPIAVSRMGATGLWQFMLKTGQGYGLQVNSLVDERRDPYKSTDAAARYLKDLYAIYGDWNLVIAAYNCGPGNVNKAITRSGGKRDYWEIYHQLPRETRGYVPAFIAANYVMNYYGDHNICPVETSTELFALDTLHVDKLIHFNQISDVLNIPVSDLKKWNPQFRRDQVPGNYKTYALVLPTNMIYAFLEKQDDILNYKRNQYQPHRLNTDNYIASTSSVSTVSGNTENIYYRVKRGDNLGKIASQNRTTVAQLRAWNNLRTTRISIGQSLVVQKRIVEAPQSDTDVELAQKSTEKRITTRFVNEYYRVRSGDNLGRIASRNGVTVAQLKSWNGLRSDRLSIGKSLIVKKRAETVEEEIEIENPIVNENAPEPIEGYQKEQIELKVPQVIEVDTRSVINELSMR